MENIRLRGGVWKNLFLCWTSQDWQIKAERRPSSSGSISNSSANSSTLLSLVFFFSNLHFVLLWSSSLLKAVQPNENGCCLCHVNLWWAQKSGWVCGWHTKTKPVGSGIHRTIFNLYATHSHHTHTRIISGTGLVLLVDRYREGEQWPQLRTQSWGFWFTGKEVRSWPWHIRPPVLVGVQLQNTHTLKHTRGAASGQFQVDKNDITNIMKSQWMTSVQLQTIL